MNSIKTDKFISAQGNLLISKNPQLEEPDGHLFLIVNHTQENMIGIGIQRRSTTMTFPMLLKMLRIEPPTGNENEFDNYPVYLGGPNPEGGIYMIHTQDYSDKSTRHVYGNVYMSNSPDTFKNLVSESKPRKWLVVHGENFFNPGAIK
ncbi:MAG: hypothetical protein GY699_02995 [Desulfobacteraceae bacterium]|nr:hypothetical protein [Desulfobacteraceae bacterium]